MRELKYFLELPDGSHQDEAALSFSGADKLIKEIDWTALRNPDRDEEPFLLFLDEGESFMMIMPETEGLRVTTRVLDKWNLFGLLTKEKSFTLDFGVVSRDDALRLLKLFFDDNYPALRALERKMQDMGGGD